MVCSGQSRQKFVVALAGTLVWSAIVQAQVAPRGSVEILQDKNGISLSAGGPHANPMASITEPGVSIGMADAGGLDFSRTSGLNDWGHTFDYKMSTSWEKVLSGQVYVDHDYVSVTGGRYRDDFDW